MEENKVNEPEVITLNNGEDDIYCEVIAQISLESGSFVLMHPRNLPEVKEDEALVFEMKEENGEMLYYYVEDSDVIDAVFAEYYRLFGDQD